MRPHAISRAARAACVALVVCLLVGQALPAGAREPRTAVQEALHDRVVLRMRLAALRGAPAERRALLRARPSLAEAVMARRGSAIDHQDVRDLQETSRRAVVRQQRGLRRLGLRVDRRIEDLQGRIGALTWWLQTTGVFRACPVPDATMIDDDFGEMVRLPKVKPHVHQGNDLLAPTWAPILAPFDGYASGSRSHLGGVEVRVRGDAGYVYNAHLAGFGRLGWVETGDVVGYVGATGDATAPHDHLEWHPWGGGAVDPHPFLVAACLPA